MTFIKFYWSNMIVFAIILILFINEVISGELIKLRTGDAQKAVAEAEKMTTAIKESCPLAHILFDVNLHPEDCNDEAIRLFDCSDKQTFLDIYWEYLMPKTQPDGQNSIEKARLLIDKRSTLDEKFSFEWTYKTYSGDTFLTEVTLQQFDYQNQLHTVAFIYDLSKIKRVEMLLEDALFEAHAANRSKQEFLSRMSHEMLTPMNAIIGMVTLLKRPQIGMKHIDFIGEIDKASLELLHLINNLLEVSENNDNPFKLTESIFSFSTLVKEVLKSTSSDILSRQQSLDTFIDPAIPVLLYGDKNRLVQVISCLINNAVKFSPMHERIDLAISLVDISDNIIIIQISVSDNGVGISEEDQKIIFNVFEQVDGGFNREYYGIGLGLPIARRIIENMGGKIWVESELNKGSKFIFTVELKVSNNDLYNTSEHNLV